MSIKVTIFKQTYPKFLKRGECDAKKAIKCGSESIPFLEQFSPPLFENSGAPLGRIDVLAGTPRTTQPSSPILKNENITGRDLPLL